MDTIRTYLTARIGQEMFAIDVTYVNNIIEYTNNITKLPEMPASILGIVNLREQVLPVADLRMLLGTGNREITERTCILVTEIEIEKEKLMMGMLVDEVNEVIEIIDNQIKTAPVISKTNRNEYLSGVFYHNSQFILILNLDKVFVTSSDSISDAA